MPDYHIFSSEDNAGRPWLLTRLGVVAAETPERAMEEVAVRHGLDEMYRLWAVADADMVWRAKDPADRSAIPPPSPVQRPSGLRRTWKSFHRWAMPGRYDHGLILSGGSTPGYRVYEALTEPDMRLTLLAVKDGDDAGLAIEKAARDRALDDATMVSVSAEALVARFIPSHTREELAAAYDQLVRRAGVNGGRNLGDEPPDSPTHSHWRSYLANQAVLDGLKVEFVGFVQTSFVEPLALLAQPNGKAYKLPIEGGTEQRIRAVERDYGPLLEQARRRATAELERHRAR